MLIVEGEHISYKNRMVWWLSVLMIDTQGQWLEDIREQRLYID